MLAYTLIYNYPYEVKYPTTLDGKNIEAVLILDKTKYCAVPHTLVIRTAIEGSYEYSTRHYVIDKFYSTDRKIYYKPAITNYEGDDDYYDIF